MNTFYIAIVDLFKQYTDDEWVTATLAWWNESLVTLKDIAAAGAEALALALEADSSGDDS
ncbi:hypothetical protein EV421DRAFT_1915391 [Armillaria borealis]|uniref:Uncharacterized protein n=1 Tax=Armillaria borealis TaxID=47425 RepID=A0AA39IEV5_9AGAR|nr:hypothetical protein EV421DRAFT_1915391 [Armillaria borealis]